MFSESTLSQIRERIDIVDLVGEYISLKKSGAGFVGLCPFHGEKTPSFHVNPQRQAFHCFGCHKGGNVFTFLQSQEGLSFPEAVKRLAKQASVEIEEDSRYRKPVVQISPAEQRLLEGLDWAAKYYHHLLLEKKEYTFALEYLKSRGISLKTIEKFRIGVSPKGWNSLMGQMMKRKYTFHELVAAGLVVQKEGTITDGWDRFRNRLMFPILDKEGNTIAFGGRILPEGNQEPPANQPKYLNSSESPIFSKRKNLYGIYENQRGIRLKGEAVVVEGYMDVVGLYEAGVQNAVATMGTALTEEHCDLIRGFTKKVVTVFDPDSAGLDAWHRSVHIFMTSRIFAKDLTLPGNQDPDEFVHKEGAAAFYDLCERAPRQITKYLKEIAKKGPLSEQQVSSHIAELMPILKATKNLPDVATLWDDISLVLKISIPTLNKLVTQSSTGPTAQVPKPAQRPGGSFQPQKRVQKPVARLHPLDREFFEAAITHPESFFTLPEETWKGAVRDSKLEALLLELKKAGNIKDFEGLIEKVVQNAEDPELSSIASTAFFRQEKKQQEPADAFKLVAERMRKRKKELEIQALSAQVKLNQRLGNQDEQLALLEKLRQLRTS